MTTTATSEQRRYGIVSVEERTAMSGLDFVQALVAGSLPINTMARTLCYDIVEASYGRVVVTACPGKEHLNPEGTVHGGFAATLLDTCMGLAVRSTLEKGFGATTLEFKISFMRPVTPKMGQVRAEGSVLTHG